MSKLHEVINSLSDESLTPEARKLLLLEVDATDKENKGLFVRAKKAEGFVFNKETKEWEKPTTEPEKTTPPKPESNEPDYAKLAFLEAKGIKHPDDQKIIQDEAKRLTLPLTDVLGMEHIQTKLKNAADQRTATEGTPQSPGTPGSGAGKSDVDFWLAKPQKADGTYETPSDQELAEKVIDARMNKEKLGNKFSDELFVG